jgi:ureidoglycolate lyase
MQLTPVTLSVENFAAYGDVVEHRGSESRRVLPTPFSSASPELRHRFTVNHLIRVTGRTIRVNELERHPFSAQTFIPLSGSRHLVVVALSNTDGQLDPATLQAFITNGHQGVSYRPAVWHFAFTAIDSDAQVAVIIGLTGRANDTEYTTLPTSADVTLL